MEIDVDEGQIVGFRRDVDHPLSEGHFCIKGRMSIDLAKGAEGRLFHSQERQRDGSYADIDSSLALDRIADRLMSIIDQYGPQSVAVFKGTGAYYDFLGSTLLAGFLKAIETPNLFTTVTIDQSGKWVAMARIGTMMSGKRQLSEADVAIVAGTNPPVSHIGFPFGVTPASNPAEHMKRFKARGGKLIVIDPRRTETAAFADIHLQPFPGQDAVLLAGLIKCMLDNGWEDEAFCDRFVVGKDDVHAAVSTFTPDVVAARTGVSPDLLEAAAAMFGGARRRAAAGGTGISMGPHSNLVEHLIEVLNIVAGGYMKAGEPIPNAGAIFPKAFVEDVVPPARTWEQGPKLRVSGAGRLFGEFPSALLPTEILGPKDKGIRALISYAGNPAMALGDPNRTIPALESLDLLVTIDARMTETAFLSDYVLAPSLPVERCDVTAFFDATFWRPFAQLATPVIPKPSTVIDDWEVFWALAGRMGKQIVLENFVFGSDLGADSGGVPLDMNERPDPLQMIEFLCGEEVYQNLVSNPGGWTPEVPTAVVESVATDSGARLTLLPPDAGDELAALRDEVAQDSFGYVLAVRRLLPTSNSAFRDAKPTRTRFPTNRAWMHPESMNAEALTDGDLVVITSKYGQIVAVAESDPSVRPGVVSMAHHWGSLDPADDPDGSTGAHTGRLVSLEHDTQSINYMPVLTGIPINVVRKDLLAHSL